MNKAYLNVVVGRLPVAVNDADGANFFLRRKFCVVQSCGRIVYRVYVRSCYCECLGFMGETKIAFLVFIINVRHLSQSVRLFLCKET